MGSISGEEIAPWGKAEGVAKEERILVSVRVRPLNAKEIEKNDPSDWECVNDTTIMFRNSLPERSAFPTAYTFGESSAIIGFYCSFNHSDYQCFSVTKGKFSTLEGNMLRRLVNVYTIFCLLLVSLFR